MLIYYIEDTKPSCYQKIWLMEKILKSCIYPLDTAVYVLKIKQRTEKSSAGSIRLFLKSTCMFTGLLSIMPNPVSWIGA